VHVQQGFSLSVLACSHLHWCKACILYRNRKWTWNS